VTLPPGIRIGAYEIVAAIGAGGMGEVYRARDTKLGREVAVKVLPPHLTHDRERLTRFEREARLLATVNHPNIAAIYGLDDSTATTALILELVEGQTLADVLKSGRMPVATALSYARQIIDALDAAHEKGIVHRDLKPANIKISPDGVVKVLDFGLAKIADDEAARPDVSQSPTVTAIGTRVGVILGTAAYMSPEQARGKAVDKRTDVWAFGCVLYEMLTGRGSFHGETVSDTIVAILDREPDWASVPADVPPTVVQLLRHCLEKDLRRRLRDIGDARLMLDTPAVLSPATATAELRPSSKKLPWIVAAVAATAAVAALLWRNATPAVSVPQLGRAIRLTNTPTPEFGPAISPDGKWVAYYASDGRRTDLWVKYLDSGSALNLTAALSLELPARTGIGGLSISPDGTQIAFVARQSATVPQFDTWIMPGPVGGTPRMLIPLGQGLQWSPDGKLITYVIGGSTFGDLLMVAASDGTGARAVVEREGGRHLHYPAWTRDGQSIVFIDTYDTWHTEPSDIYSVPVTGGRPAPVVTSPRRAIYPAPMTAGGLVYAGNPTTLELGLWWRPPDAGKSQPLTNGLGEHTEVRLSADGRRLVATLLDIHQSIMSVPVDPSSAPKPLTEGFGGDIEPNIDPRSGRIVFSSSRAGHRSLWTANADASGATPLTNDPAIDERPAFSPDGQQIAFMSDRDGQRGIWLVNAQGGAPRLLAHQVALDVLSWSRDGRRIFFARPTKELPALASVGVDDGKVEAVATTGAAFSPVCSPTEDVIAYLESVTPQAASPATPAGSRNYIRFMDASGKRLFATLPDQVQFANGFLAWSPDGRRLAGASVSAAAPSQLWVVEPTSATPFRKIADLPVSSRPRGLTWTADGTHVVFGNVAATSDIVMYDVQTQQR